MGNLFAELKRRHIYRVAAAYAVVAWVLVQLIGIMMPAFDMPSWTERATFWFLGIGFPVVLIFAWVHELGSAQAGGTTAASAHSKLDWLLIGALAAVIAIFFYQQLVSSPGARKAQPATVAASPAPPSQTGGVSIAVLPFANMSGDTAQEFFSDGMTEEINSALAKIPDLIVIGRTSAFQYKGRAEDLRAIGQALSASYLIEGSVRKAGDRVRITAQLIRADSGAHLWTENYDRQLTDIFATQEDIAEAIAAALRVPLGLQQGDTLVRNRTNDRESYDQYLRARALWRARGEANSNEAITLLEKLVARDPNFAPAWALLGRAYRTASSYSPERVSGSLEEARRVVQSAQDKAEKAAREAIRLDSRNADGYGALAGIQAVRQKTTASVDLFQQALALDPNAPDVLDDYSTTLAYAGRFKEALSIKEKLRTLEPFVPAYNVTTASIMQYNGQNAASIPILEAIPADAAGGFSRNLYLARAYAAEGRYAEAADTLLLITSNAIPRRTVEDAARLLRQAPTKVNTPQALPALDLVDFIYAYIGAFDRLLDRPERQSEIEGPVFGTPSLWLPVAVAARRTERFKALVRKIGLVDYWRARGWPDLCRPMGANDFVCD